MNKDSRLIVQCDIIPVLKKYLKGKFKHYKGKICEIDNIAVDTEYYNDNYCKVNVIYHDVEKPDMLWSCSLEHFISTKVDDPNVLRFEPIDNSDLRSYMIDNYFPDISLELSQYLSQF